MWIILRILTLHSVIELKITQTAKFLWRNQNRSTRKKIKNQQVNVGDDESKRNWLDNEVETLIALKEEMQPEFIRNAKKQDCCVCNLISRKLLRPVRVNSTTSTRCTRTTSWQTIF